MKIGNRLEMGSYALLEIRVSVQCTYILSEAISIIVEALWNLAWEGCVPAVAK